MFMFQSESHLKFFIFAMKQVYPETPSLSQLKAKSLPDYIPPKKVNIFICSKTGFNVNVE